MEDHVEIENGKIIVHLSKETFGKIIEDYTLFGDMDKSVSKYCNDLIDIACRKLLLNDIKELIISAE